MYQSKRWHLCPPQFKPSLDYFLTLPSSFVVREWNHLSFDGVDFDWTTRSPALFLISQCWHWHLWPTALMLPTSHVRRFLISEGFVLVVLRSHRGLSWWCRNHLTKDDIFAATWLDDKHLQFRYCNFGRSKIFHGVHVYHLITEIR